MKKVEKNTIKNAIKIAREKVQNRCDFELGPCNYKIEYYVSINVIFDFEIIETSKEVFNPEEADFCLIWVDTSEFGGMQFSINDENIDRLEKIISSNILGMVLDAIE